jgi:hypothetical protein
MIDLLEREMTPMQDAESKVEVPSAWFWIPFSVPRNIRKGRIKASRTKVDNEQN